MSEDDLEKDLLGFNSISIKVKMTRSVQIEGGKRPEVEFEYELLFLFFEV